MKPQVCNICNTVTVRKNASKHVGCAGFMERRVGMRGTAAGTSEEGGGDYYFLLASGCSKRGWGA